MIIGAEFEVSQENIRSVNVMYSNNALHGAPISFNTVTNTLCKIVLGEEFTISASNEPLHSVIKKLTPVPKSTTTSLLMWATLFPLGN